jgi:hypothetical protein
LFTPKVAHGKLEGLERVDDQRMDMSEVYQRG